VNATTTVSILRNGVLAPVATPVADGEFYAVSSTAKAANNSVPVTAGQSVTSYVRIRNLSLRQVVHYVSYMSDAGLQLTAVGGPIPAFVGLQESSQTVVIPATPAGITWARQTIRWTGNPAPAPVVGERHVIEAAQLGGKDLDMTAGWGSFSNAAIAYGSNLSGSPLTDQYGDPVDTLDTVYSGVPFSLLEQDSKESDPSTGESRVVRYVTGRCYPGVDLKRGDRVRDERTGILYAVDGVTRPQSPVGTPDVRSELRRLGG
jgi:hypothetical protein